MLIKPFDYTAAINIFNVSNSALEIELYVYNKDTQIIVTLKYFY